MHLLVGNTHDSGWRVLGTMVAFPALRVPSGHRVDFVCRPTSPFLGPSVVAAALLGGLPSLLWLAPFVEA